MAPRVLIRDSIQFGVCSVKRRSMRTASSMKPVRALPIQKNACSDVRWASFLRCQARLPILQANRLREMT